MIGSLILVVDDDRRTRDSLEIAFPQYKFIGARNGEEALRLLEKPNEVDMVVLDYRMNGMSGVEVSKKIRQVDRDLPLIFLTAFGSKETVIEAWRSGADEFIDKPFEIDAVSLIFTKYLKSRFLTMDSGNQHAAVARVIRILERNFNKSVSLTEISGILSMHPKYLSRLFKEKSGRSFVEYRTWLRLEKAKAMLKKSMTRIGQISDEIGYQNMPSFAKAFKKNVGCTPQQFRHNK